MLTPRPHQHRPEPGDHLPKVPGVLHPTCALAGGQILAPRAPPPLLHTNQFISSSRSGVQAPSCLCVNKMTWVPWVTQQVKSYHLLLGCPGGPCAGPGGAVSVIQPLLSSLLGGFEAPVPWGRRSGRAPCRSPRLHPMSQSGPGGADSQLRVLTASSPSACSHL